MNHLIGATILQTTNLNAVLGFLSLSETEDDVIISVVGDQQLDFSLQFRAEILLGYCWTILIFT